MLCLFTRRELLVSSGSIATLAIVSPRDSGATVGPALPAGAHEEQLRSTYPQITGYLSELIQAAKVCLDSGSVLLLPSGDASYNAVWPDARLFVASPAQ